MQKYQKIINNLRHNLNNDNLGTRTTFFTEIDNKLIKFRLEYGFPNPKNIPIKKTLESLTDSEFKLFIQEHYQFV